MKDSKKYNESSSPGGDATSVDNRSNTSSVESRDRRTDNLKHYTEAQRLGEIMRMYSTLEEKRLGDQDNSDHEDSVMDDFQERIKEEAKLSGHGLDHSA